MKYVFKSDALFYSIKKQQVNTMKKLSTLTVALFLSAGMAFAQSNDATISQVGDNHDANISQTGNTNTGSISVYAGAGSVTVIEQVGNENKADIEDVRDNIDAEQRQDGNENTAYIGQAGQNSIIIQLQYGDKNSATFIGHDKTSVKGNFAILGQFGEGNTAEIIGANNNNEIVQNQDGDNNIASVTGYNYSENDHLLSQWGDGNSAYLELPDGAKNNSSTVNQTGDSNMGFVSQMGEYNVATIGQTGNSNTASITQGL